MEIAGKIIQILPSQTGEGRNGTWTKQEYVLEFKDGSFMKKLAFTVFGAEKIAQFAIKEGEDIKVSINIESREYNGKFYHDVRAWRIDRVSAASASSSSTPSTQDTPWAAYEGSATNAPINESDDLPF